MNKNYVVNLEEMEELKEYWTQKLDGVSNELYIKPDFIKISGMKRNEIQGEIDEILCNKLIAVSKGQELLMFVVLTAALKIMLFKYSGNKDVTVAAPVYKEYESEYNKCILLRDVIRDGMEFREFLKTVRQTVIEGFQNQHYPVERMLETAGIKQRDLSLAKVMLVLENIQRKETRDFIVHSMKNQITFSFAMEQDSIKCKIIYNPGFFREDSVLRIFDHYVFVLKQLLDNMSIKPEEVLLVNEREMEKILVEFNKTQREYLKDRTAHVLFEEQVDKTPQGIALVCKEQQLTYRELDNRANQVAACLREEYRIVPGTLVGIYIDNSIELLISILGILKAGGAYVPISRMLPPDRVKNIVEDSGVSLIVTLLEHQHELENLKQQCSCSFSIFPVDRESLFVSYPSDRINSLARPSDVAYVIYTSGTTGRPKGVMIEHKGLSNLKCFFETELKVNSTDRILQFANNTFDASVWEIFMALFLGAELHILTEDVISNYVMFETYVESIGITTVTLPPTYLAHLSPGKMQSVKRLITAGSAISADLLMQWNNQCDYINAYGPTETTICATLWRYDGDVEKYGSVPIGKPITNTRIYILDSERRVRPIGMDGELCISGAGLARGYLHMPELTAEKFVDNPYEEGEKMYRTGDLARWLPDGNIEFLGRIDNQVKVRGYRIEPEDIEQQMLKHEALKEAVVVEKKDVKGDSFLCAYFVPVKEVSSVELRRFLSKVLPNYMLPSFFIKMDMFPLSVSGKVDKNKLPEPDLSLAEPMKYDEPTNDIEEVMIQLWANALGIRQDRIGIYDNFFHLGGNSMSVMTVKTQAYLLNWNLSTEDFYKYQTVKELADKILGNVLESEEQDEEMIILDIAEVKHKSDLDHIVVGSERNEFNHILLTGATGFLGAHLLDYLLKKTDAVIYCIVRGKTKDACTQKLVDILNFYFPGKYEELLGRRILLINGDLSQDYFGLTEREYQELSEKIDLAIHSAALVKHYGAYSEFKKVNVNGTKAMVEFCEKNHCKLSYVSTVSVSGGIREQKEDVKYTENDFYIGQEYDYNLYVRSKFEAENIVLKAIGYGLDASVFRVGNLGERYDDGQFQRNAHENAFHITLGSMVDLGAMHKDIVDVEFELTPVDYCSKAIVDLTFLKESEGKVFHILNHRKAKFKDFVKAFKKLKVDMKILNSEEFEEHYKDLMTKYMDFYHTYKDRLKLDESAAQSGLDENFGEIISGAHESEEGLNPVDIDSQITQSYLKKIHFQWPAIDISYLIKIGINIINMGHFPVEEKLKNPEQYLEVE